MDAIKAATSSAAFHMAMDRNDGAITQDRYGDIIAVEGNPLTNADQLKIVSTVI